MMCSQGVRRSGAASLDLCYLACGRLDAFWEWKLKPWDMAAGRLILEEAGGRITDATGGPHRLNGDETVASNGPLHAEMLAMIARVREAASPGRAHVRR
jgi:myo-inositol-1(or 4)-monophosphatase